MSTNPKLSLISNCLERPQIACGSSLQESPESPESLESNQHKVQWAARCWKTLAIPLAVSNTWPTSQTRSPRERSEGTRIRLCLSCCSVSSICPQALWHERNITSLHWSRLGNAPLIPYLFKRTICATRHLDFLIRLAVMFARLQIRESTLGPLRPERNFRCPAFTPTGGLAMCSNKLLD